LTDGGGGAADEAAAGLVFHLFAADVFGLGEVGFLGEGGGVLDYGVDDCLAGDGWVGSHLVELFLGYGLGLVVVDYVAVVGGCVVGAGGICGGC